MFVFDTAPQTLDEHIVNGSALTVHADVYRLAFQILHPQGTSELTTLVAVDDLGLAIVIHGLHQYPKA